MADFWKNYDNGKFSVGGKKDEEKKKSTSFWDEYDSGKYSVGGNRGSNDIKKVEELLAEKGLGRTAYRLPESLSKPAADTRNESQKQYDDYLGTLRSSADIQKELNVVGDALKIERDKRRSDVRNQLRDGNDITMASGKPQANAELDSRISKLQNRYSELEQELKNNTYANYERNRLADDFAENSKYRSTDNGGVHSRMDLLGDTLITGYGNWKNEIINRNPDALEALNEQTAGAGLATGASIDLPSLTGNDYSWTQSMTDDQISMYNYIANTKGAEEADKYLDYIRSDVYAADRARIESEAQAYANEHPVLASGKTVLQAPMKGIAYVGQTIDYLADGKIDENAPYNRYSYEPTAMRNAVQKQVEDRWGGVGSFLYGTGMSMADFLFEGVISGGAEWVSLGLMGTGAAADTVLEAKSRGLSDDQAFALGTVAGAAEILTEKVSVDRVFGAIRDRNGWVGKNIKEVLLNLAGDTIAEGTEEAVSDVINCVADILAAGEKSEWETAIRTYREQNPGMTESDAFKYAFLDKMKEIGLDFLGGALSGFLMSGGAAGINTGITAAQKNRERSQGIELARQARNEAGTPGDFEFLPDNEGGFTLPTAAETMDTAEDVGEIRTGSEKSFDGTLPTAEESDLERKIDAADTETEKTGIRYGVDQKEIDSAKRLSRATGMKISYFSQDAKNGTMDNGFYNPQTGEIQLNAKSKQKTAVTVSHELTHSFEGTDAYTALQEYAKGDTLRKGKNWATERERIRGLYQRAGIDLPGESAIDAEITAQWMESNFGSERDIAEICRDNPSLAKKIRDGLDTIVLKLADLSGRQTWYEAEEIRNVMATYDRMLEKYEKDVQAKLETSRGAKTDAATDAGAVQENATERSTEGETAEEFYARMEDAHNAGEIDDELWEDAQAIYDEWTSVGNGESTTVADDGPEGRLPKWFREKKEVLENAVTRKAAGRKIREEMPGEAADRTETEEPAAAAETQQATATPTMAQSTAREAQPIAREAQPIAREATLNRKAVLENDNFRRWFGESKVVNEDGSPKIMYHGTSNGGFEMFDAWGKSNYGLFGTGSYFTDNPDVAETYTKKGKGKNPQIYPVYLSIQNPIDMDAAADIEAWKAALTPEEESDFGFDLRALDNLKTNEDVYREIEDQVESFDVGKIEGAEIMQSILEGMGYDGITHIGGGRVNADDPRHRVYIAFEGGQVKSAVQNNGDFSSDDWNIHHSISRVTAGNADEVLAENGVTPIADDVAVKHSLSTWAETEKVNVRKALKEKGFESEDIDKWISDMNTIAAIIGDDRARLDFEANPDQTFVKPNQEYRYTVDASTLCAKRLLYTGTFDAIQHALPNTVLNSDDVLALMNMMKDAGYEAPCSVCYVESRRRNTGRFAKKWMDSYNGDYKPRIDELTTVDGREKLEREHPQAYNDFMNAMNRIGTNNPKITQTRTEYRGEIRKFSDTLVETLNEAGGLRLQSFSDFETPHLLDMMQVVTDMSARGLTSQAYTKIPAFARVFGGTGIKINLSLIADGNGFDENGNLAFSSREGMDIDEAMEIREKYGENVGTIIVGVNDKHILACMADDRIDFIIPFHKSGWGKAQIAQMGMEAYMDYTRFQNEKDITTGKKVKENIQPLDYWDFGVSGKENAETYLRLCAEQGRIPKFSRFLQDNGDGSWSLPADGSTDGYWKLLTDYKMYDNDGNGAPQRLVRPDIDMDAAREILEDYKGGANSLPVAQDIVDRFVAEKRKGSTDIQRDIENSDVQEGAVYTSDVKHSIVEDPDELSFLDNQETITVYRAMQLVDGQLLPPMASKIKKDSNSKKREYVDSSKINQWEKADEHPELIKMVNGKPKFTLDKGNGSSIDAAYNPYFHSSAYMLNDQFSSAYERPNLVVVEGVIPKSELSSGYQAQYAKDPVGKTTWKAGPVAGKMKGDKVRYVYLSRWFKPVRVVPDAEAAANIADVLRGENVAVPYNVVTPTLREELVKAGVPISSKYNDSSIEYADVQHSVSEEEDREYMDTVNSGDMDAAQQMVDKAASKAGYIPVTRYHQTGSVFTKFSTDNPVAGAYDSETPNGIFFKDNDHDIGVGGDYANTGHGGEIQMRTYLKHDNLLRFKNREDARSWYNKNIEGYKAVGEEMKKSLAPIEEKMDALEDDYFMKDLMNEEEFDKKWNELLGELRTRENEYRGKQRKLLNDYFLGGNSNYDGIELVYDGHRYIDGKRENVHTYIVFSPEQVKSAAPVTRDDNGNVIPLSQRFNAEKTDIRYSVSDENETGPIYELPAKPRSNALKIEAQLARRLDSALDLGLAGPNGGMTDTLKKFRTESVRPIVEAFLRDEEPDTASLWSEYATDPLQQHAFDQAFEDALPALEQIRGFGERARSEKEARDARNAELDAQIPTEAADLVKLAESVKQAKRNLATVRGRLMLTEEDERTVRAILDGEMSESEAAASHQLSIDQILEAVNAEREARRAEAPWVRYTQRMAAQRRADADKHLENAASWNDKKAGWRYDRETAERNIRDITPDGETADALIRDYFRPVHTAEAKSTRFKNDYIRRVQGLKLGMKATGNNTASESYAVQYLGEAEDNIRYLQTIRSPKAVRDGHNLQEWQAEVEAFKADNPDMDWAKVNKGIQEFSTIYGELIGQMNGVLVENGYMPVNVRRGYFPHFNGGEDTIMARFGNLLGMKINTAALPTSINGLTAGFKPGKTWFGHAQERLGFQTTYDAVQGFQNYIGGVADVIHQTDNLRNLRALATQVRYRTSDEQIQNQIDEIMANDTLDEAERQTLVDALKQNGRYQLSNFVAWLDEYTNLLANKKSKFDRGVEDLMGRGFYAGMKNLEGRVAANMISANLGSALTNFIPLHQASAMLGDRNVLRGMYQTVRGYASDDGFRDRSDFLVNRRGTDPLYQKTSQKISEFLSTPMILIDNFTSESIVRAAYNRYRNQGMDAEEAMTAADEFAAGVMADRSKGAQPVIFGSRNPLLKLFTQFQVEVNNEYSTIFKDIPRDYKDKAVWVLLRYFLGAYIFNDIYEKVVGRRAALDPVDLINETVGGLTGYKAPNTVDIVGDLIGGEDIDWGSAEDREDPYVAITDTLSGAAEELPFVGGLLGGGRIPISSALPDKDNMLKALLSTSWSPKKRLFTAGQEIGKSIGTYVIPPFAGGFGKKIADTAVNMARGGRYTVDKDGNDVLQYPYYTDDGAVGTALKSALFGPTATEGGQKWIESGFKSLSAEQTSDYQGLTNYGADQRRAYEVAQMPGSKKADKIAKYRASINLVDSADDKDSVFELMADDKDANKFRAAKRCAGLDAETYVGWLEFLPRYDADGNGSMTQAETITAIDDYARKVGLTYPERAALYQLQGTTWKENPYDNEVGAAIKAMLGK